MEKRIKRLGKCFFLTLGVLGAASLTGCSEEVSALFGSDGTAVEVTARVADAADAMTRAADGLNSTSGFTLTTTVNSASKVRVMVDKNDGDYSQFDYNVTGATTINRDSKPTFPSGVNSVNVYGWYPAKSLENFTVDANQTGSNGYCLSDLLFAKGATCTRNSSTGEVENAASLTFNHVMAKVKVNLTLAEGVTVKSAKFKSMMRTVTVTTTQSGNVVTGCSVGAASSAGDITLLTDGTLTNASSDADKLLCGVFPEQTKSGAFLEIVANYDGGSDQTITYSFDNSSSKPFGSGNEYLMNITLKGTDITTGTVSIANWGTAAGTVNIGGGALELAPTSLTMTYGDAAQTLTISGSVTIKSDGTTSFNVTSSDTNVATVSTTGTTVTVTPQNAGSTTITVTDANKPGNTASCTVSVNKAAASFSVPSTLTINGLGRTNTFNVIRPGTGNDGQISCVVSDGTGSATLSNIDQSTGVVTIQGNTAGTATVTVSVGAGTNYEASTSTQDVAVTISADDRILLSSITSSSSSYKGYYVGQDGYAYNSIDYATRSGTSAVARITYVGSVSGYFDNFLAIALEDASSSTAVWATQMSAANTWASSHSVTVGGTTYNSCSTSAYDQVTADASGTTSKPKSSGAVKGWRVPSVTDWKYIFDGIGGKEVDNSKVTDGIVYGTSTTSGNSDGSHRALLNIWCGQAWNATTKPQAVQSSTYWSSSERAEGTDDAWSYTFYSSKFPWYGKTGGSIYVRAVFAY